MASVGVAEAGAELNASLHPGSGRVFGPCSVMALVCAYPRLLSCTVIRHPCKTVILLRNTEVAALRQLLEVVPRATAQGIMHHLLNDLSRRQFFEVLPPLLNAEHLRGPLALILQLLEPQHAVVVINAVPVRKLAIVLAAPPEALAAVVTAVDLSRLETVLIPVLQESEALLQGTLVPLLQQVRRPAGLGDMMNRADLPVLLWILRGVDAPHLAAFLDALEPADFAEGSTLMAFLKLAAEDPDLVDEKVLPLLRQGDPENVVPFMRGVNLQQLVAVLNHVDAEGLLRLLANTNTELAVRMCNGPLEDVVKLCSVAWGFAEALRNPLAAHAIRHSSNALNLVAAGIEGSLHRGKEVRGANSQASYKLGDITRGLLASQTS